MRRSRPRGTDRGPRSARRPESAPGWPRPKQLVGQKSKKPPSRRNLNPGPWGVSVSRNITSHKENGIGAWSDDEIKRAITKGVRKDGTPLKPPMGFGFYANMTDGDLDAVVAYLRTVPAKE